MSIDWHIKGRQFGNCNCNYGCPCQFNAPPTDNSFKTFLSMEHLYHRSTFPSGNLIFIKSNQFLISSGSSTFKTYVESFACFITAGIISLYASHKLLFGLGI